MNWLRNRKIAALLTAGIIVLACLFGGYRSLNALRNDAYNVFVMGELGDGVGIQSDLNERMDLAYNLTIVAKKYLDADNVSIQGVLEARQTLSEAVTIGQKSSGNQALTTAMTTLYYAMENLDLSEQDAKYRRELFASFQSRNDTISHDPYNGYAQEFNQTLQSFPANILAGLTGVRSLEFFQ